MGFTSVKVRIYNPDDMSRWRDVELLVDTGAVFTSVPRNVLEEIGIKPFSRRRFRVYGGEVVERDLCFGLIEYEGRIAGVTMICCEPKDTPILGVTALESLGYQVDPVTKRLKPVELLMI